MGLFFFCKIPFMAISPLSDDTVPMGEVIIVVSALLTHTSNNYRP